MGATGDAASLAHSCRLPLSTTTLNHVAGLLRAHLKAIGSRWRSLPAGRIALLVLAVLHHDQRDADLAGGNDISAATMRRWTNEVIDLLAARAPRLVQPQALHLPLHSNAPEWRGWNPWMVWLV